MRWLPRHVLMGLLLLAVGPCRAAPPVSAPAVPASAPDYGGRDAPGLLSGAGADAPSPAAQAGRTLLALVLVLGGVYGGVRLLKRGGYTGGPVGAALLSGLGRSLPSAPQRGTTAGGVEWDGGTSNSLRLLQSQPLPGGGAVHLLSVQGRTLVLVGATAQGVSLITEWETETEGSPVAAGEVPPAPQPAFQEYLARVDVPPIPPRAPERVPIERLSDLLSTQRARSHEDTRE